MVVADTGNHRVRVISQSGKRNLVFGKYGKEEGDFDGPHSVAVDKYDNIYVADLYNQRLQVGKFQLKFINETGIYNNKLVGHTFVKSVCQSFYSSFLDTFLFWNQMS